MAQWLCMNCLKPKSGTKCPHCGRSDSELWNDGSQLPVFTRLKDGRYTVGVALSRWGTTHGYTYGGWDSAANRVVHIKECAFVTEFGKREWSIPTGNTNFYEHRRTCQVNWETQRRWNLPALPQMLDIFEEGDTVYGIQEKVEGIPLDQFVANLGGTLNAAGTIRLFGPLMKDLSCAHSAGLFHENITKGSIAITSDGRARFFDMGTADNFGDADLPLLPPRSPYTYLNQSRFSRQERAQREDIYQMGTVIYECLTGRELKYNGGDKTPQVLNWIYCDPMFNTYMRRVVERAISADPKYQFATMEEFYRELYRGINWKEPLFEPIR